MIPNKVITNMRYGLATNSSSSHSIIYNEKMNTGTDRVSFDYGWDFFTLESKEEKNSYMMAQLMGNLGFRTVDILEYIAKEYNAYDSLEDLFEKTVDHQSVIPLPKDKNWEINLDFFNNYKKYISENDFIILGGNDNDDSEHSMASYDTCEKDSYMYSFHDNDRAYKNGNYYVVINEFRKMRINFNEEENIPKFPELIDIKITDYCDIGCKFCYQNSTEEGKHANYQNIYSMMGYTYGQNIYEFAIGGGEPTTHPDFAKILKALKSHGNYVNFTTRSKKWFSDKKIVEAVNENVSGVAYSVNGVIEMGHFASLHMKHLNRSVKMYVHIIPELMTEKKLIKIIEAIDKLNHSAMSGRIDGSQISITLLGFKDIGRGENIKYKRHKNLIKIIKQTRRTKIGIDTKLAKDYEEELKEENISKKLYDTREGVYSMYYDAIEEKAYKSSYELDNPIEVKKNKSGFREGIDEIFKKVRTTNAE
jgi:organic radical activating enzyme